MDESVISPKQMSFLTGSNARVNMTEGSIRSGKTIITLTRWAMFITKAPKTGELVMIGRTRDAVWRNCIAPLQSPELFGPLADNVTGNHGAPTVNILGRKVHILGASDVKAEKVIRGMTVAGAYVDEATTIPEEFFTQLLGRMSVKGARMFASTNPDNPAHWMKTKFLDRLDKLTDWKSWHFGLDDNPSLTDSYKNSIKTEFTGLWYKRFILGEWVAAEGAVFDTWDEDRHVVPWVDLPPMSTLIAIGVDYGTSNATAAILIGMGVDGVMYAVDEWSWDAKQTQHNLTNAELAEALIAWTQETHTPDGTGGTPKFTVVDPSALSFRTELSAHGYQATQADNDVQYGLRTLMSMLAEGQYKISDRCPGLIKEIPGYAWDPKAAEKGEDKPIKVADHHIDAWRYATVTTEQFWLHKLRRNEDAIA